MRKAPTLLYIVNGYDGGFPEAELPYLAKGDWQVIMLPRLPYSLEGRTLPKNVSVSDCLQQGKWAKLPFLLHPEIFSLWHREYRRPNGRKPSPQLKAFGKTAAIVLHARNELWKLITQNELHKGPLAVYTYWYSEATIAAGMLRKEFPHLRVISRAHGGDLYPEQSPHGYLPFRYMRHELIDKIFPCSDDGLSSLLRDDLSPDKAETARLGTICPPEVCLPSPNGEIVLYSCSGMAKVKRLSLLADSMAAFARSRPQLRVTWHHVGGGTGFERFREHAHASLHGVSNLQWHLHGMVTPEEVRQFLLSRPLDGLVSVSSSEGLPVSMMEALAVGLPLLGTDVGGVKEIVTPDSGILLPPSFTPEAFAAAVERLQEWKDEEKRRRNKAFALRYYNMDTNYTFFAEHHVRQELECSEHLLSSRE